MNDQRSINQKKINAARLSIISNSVLMTGKIAVGFFMGSISVLSDGIHSGMDLLAALIAYTAVRKAAKPADEKHRFGHGKFENLASTLEATLILFAAAGIVWYAVPRLINPTPIESLGVGGIMLTIAIVVNIFVSQHLMQVAKETDSPALEAGAWHLRTDVYTSAGVLLGLGIIQVTGWLIVDPLIGILVAAIIIRAACKLIKESLKSILDVKLPDDEEERIRSVLAKYQNEYAEFHGLRTRKAGSERHIDLHLVAPANNSVAAAHKLCDRIEKEIKELFPQNVHVLIHIEPCDCKCEHCAKKEKEGCT